MLILYNVYCADSEKTLFLDCKFVIKKFITTNHTNHNFQMPQKNYGNVEIDDFLASINDEDDNVKGSELEANGENDLNETYVIHDDNDGIFYQPDTKAILKDEVLQHMDETQRNTYQLGNAVYDSIKKELEKGERTYVYTIKKKKWTNPSSVKKDTGDEDDNELKNE